MSQNVLSGLYPSRLWANFEAISAIPRPSKHEEKVRDFLASFGRAHGLETTVDRAGNILIRKPASPGMENRKTICLQAHMDMVPQKNEGTQHDFLKDPIRPRIDGDVVRAQGTTLGADNGIGVAMIMAILECKDITHGPIEALITSDEEVGMSGAKGLQPGVLTSSWLLNLDGEDDEEITIGCAGGLDTSVSLPAPREKLTGDWAGFEVRVSGLRGGHSGVDIALGRANSHILMARLLLSPAPGSADLHLCSLEGGSARNAIPRETRAVVAVRRSWQEAFKQRLEEEARRIRNEYGAADPDIRVGVTGVEPPSDAICSKEAQAILSCIFACPNGVSFLTPGMPDLAETSSNLAIVKTDGEKVTIQLMQRSSVDSRKDEIAHRIRACFELAGADVTHQNNYPGWRPNLQSPLLQLTLKEYEKKFGRKAMTKATHGGLECGLLMGLYPDLDAISIGPRIQYPHSPDEQVSIPSVGRFWDFLLELLKAVPAK